jgi:dolichol-phosphate mannosyltransferase
MMETNRPSVRVLIAIASYNERLSLPLLLDRIFEGVAEAMVLVIDDASPDGTGIYCEERAKGNARLRVIHRGGKLGLGSAILASFDYAIKHHFDLLVGLDADLSHPPEKIPDLIACVLGADGGPGCDVAIGSRYAAGGGIEGWPFHRRFASALVNSFARIALGLPVRDCSGGFRCFKVATLAPVVRTGLRANGYAIFEEVLLRLVQQGAKLKEVPYTFVDRTKGKSKLTMKETLRAVLALFGLALGRFTRLRRRASADPR